LCRLSLCRHERFRLWEAHVAFCLWINVLGKKVVRRLDQAGIDVSTLAGSVRTAAGPPLPLGILLAWVAVVVTFGEWDCVKLIHDECWDHVLLS
jgi:hypothetical protein